MSAICIYCGATGYHVCPNLPPIPKKQYRVVNYTGHDTSNQAIQAWLNKHSGRLISVFWYGGAGLHAVYEVDEY